MVEDRFEGYLERIRDVCRLPSVSATGEGVRETADAVADLIRGAGGSVRAKSRQYIIRNRRIIIADVFTDSKIRNHKSVGNSNRRT